MKTKIGVKIPYNRENLNLNTTKNSEISTVKCRVNSAQKINICFEPGRAEKSTVGLGRAGSNFLIIGPGRCGR